MRRALYIVTAMDTGGAETVFMKFYRALDRSKYQLDFCVSSDKPGFYDNEIRELGGNIIHTVKKTEAGPIASFRRLEDIARQGSFCCAVRSSQHSLSSLDLLAMKLGGVPRTVFRSSNTGTVSNNKKELLLHRIFRPLVGVAATDFVAPSTEAGIYMFGRSGVQSSRFHILHNAIDLNEYSYDETARNRIRLELGIPANAFVVGHVGRFNQQKNHAFLLDVFVEVAKVRKDAVLLLVGKGELLDAVMKKAARFGMQNRVRFAGVRSDTAACYSAMDVVVFPSLYEGLPNVIVEAQANGLPCVMSNTITSEVVVCDNVSRLPLTAPVSLWGSVAVHAKRIPETSSQMAEAGFDIERELGNFVSLVFGERSA